MFARRGARKLLYFLIPRVLRQFAVREKVRRSFLNCVLMLLVIFPYQGLWRGVAWHASLGADAMNGAGEPQVARSPRALETRTVLTREHPSQMTPAQKAAHMAQLQHKQVAPSS